jgi:hypothetical protein
MRALVAAGLVGAMSGIGLLREDSRFVSGEHRRGAGLLALLAAVLLWAAALRERSQRDELRRRVALHLAPPPNL